MDTTTMYLKQQDENQIVHLYNVSAKTLSIYGEITKPYNAVLMPIAKANMYKSMLGNDVYIVK